MRRSTATTRSDPIQVDALDQEIDRLYALPLADFIGERNALAKRLRGGGDRAAADQVKALAKPTVTAWAVNALYHHERDRFDALLEAAAAVRAALAGKGDRRQAEKEKRQALKGLVGRAAKVLTRAGSAATPAHRQRVSHTLETLAARRPEDDEPRLGRLTADLEPQGFDALAGLAASLAPPSSPTARAPARKKLAGQAAAEKRAATVEPDERLVAARRQMEERQTALAEAERQAEAAEADAAEAKDRHERLIEEAAEAERLARAAAKALARAKTELAAANKAATQAKTARRSARSRLATARRKLERLES